jgi:hypothetical protein
MVIIFSIIQQAPFHYNYPQPTIIIAFTTSNYKNNTFANLDNYQNILS